MENAKFKMKVWTNVHIFHNLRSKHHNSAFCILHSAFGQLPGKLQFRVFIRLRQGRSRTACWNVYLSGKQCIFPEKHNFLGMYFEGENHQNAKEELGSVHKIFTDILTAHEKNDRLIKNQCTKECTLKCIFE